MAAAWQALRPPGPPAHAPSACLPWRPPPATCAPPPPPTPTTSTRWSHSASNLALSLSLSTLALLLSHQSLLSDFQVCYVLHAAPAAPPRLPGRPSRPGAADPTHANTLPPCLPDEPPLCGLWRFLAFHIVWGRLERLIQVRCISLFSLHGACAALKPSPVWQNATS
jgi:hypothetical protein